MLNTIHTNNLPELVKNLDQFKEHGMIKFENVLSIPVTDRIPGLVEKYGKMSIHGLIVVMLTKFVNSFNLIRPMTGEQIVECAFEMIDSASEDTLSIEDFALFFQGAKSAKYGKVLDRMDQQTVFELFENYRQERHSKYLQLKYEKEAQYKSSGIRTSDEKGLKELLHEANLEHFKKTNSQETCNSK